MMPMSATAACYCLCLGDCIAIMMPMSAAAVVIYLAILLMGGTAVSIADSFSSCEVATRLGISKAKAIFTQVRTPGSEPRCTWIQVQIQRPGGFLDL